MNIQQIRDSLKPIDDLWNRALVADAAHPVEHIQPALSGTEATLVEPLQPALKSWHGYGWHMETTVLVVSPFADNLKDLAAITTQFKQLLPQEVKVDGLVMPRFQLIGSGKPKELANPFQPGNVILRDCISAHNGTIGAFLTAADGNIWLLSNSHVMADCSGNKLLGAGRVELGMDVRSVQLQNTNNLVDAAVVKIADSIQVNPHFEEIGPVNQFDPKALSNLLNETPPIGITESAVSKFGNFTKLTNGKLVLQCSKVKVADLEFVDQLAIISNGTFAAGGDSGSLVVSNTQPIGLLFAMTDDDVEIPPEQNLKPPFYLANRWDKVIQELSALNVVGSPLTLMLEKEKALAVEISAMPFRELV
jgi:hypothetical protein